MITLTGVARSVGGHPLFSDVSFQVVAGRRIALVGANGEGKTTLLDLVAGEQLPDSGEISRLKDVRIGYLKQEIAASRGRTVLEEVLDGASHVTRMEPRLRELEALLEIDRPDHEALLHEYGQLQDRFRNLGGYELEADAHRILGGLGFAPEDASRDVAELSGGWAMRVGLARLLLARPDLLLLDEPTNHLDIDSIAWLEQTLHDWNGALLFVSHDREFIEGVATHVLELWNGTITEYVGGYEDFVEQREQRLEQLRAAARNQQREIAQTERFIRRFRAKATKARQVQSRIKSLEKMNRIEVPDDDPDIPKFGFPQPPRSGRVVVELSEVGKSYGDHVVYAGVDLALERAQKVALVGPNGAGKTTLLRLLAGDLSPDRGERTLGHNVEVSYFTQHQVDALDPERTVLQEFRHGLPDVHRGKNHRTMLGAFGFTGDDADKLVKVLSGGEQTRLALAKLMARSANLLCLDEPTNHLDIPSRDVLEDALLAYPGTIVLVTHDRHVIRSVADTIVEVANGRVTLYPGDYDLYLWRTGRSTTDPAALADERVQIGESPPTDSGGPSDRRVEREDRKRREAEQRNALHRATRDLREAVARTEQELEKAEAEVARLNRLLADPEVYDDDEAVKRLVIAHGDAKDRASELMSRWEKEQLALEAAEADVLADFPE